MVAVADVTTRNVPTRECVFAVKGSGVVVRQSAPGRSVAPGSAATAARNVTASVTAESEEGSKRQADSTAADIQRHLHDLLSMIREEDSLKMAVRLESVHGERCRYLAVVASGSVADQCCVLGIDRVSQSTTIGLVCRLTAETDITLDGDGGIVVRDAGQTYIVKPVSVQAMWSALQTLHKCCSVCPRPRPASHDWVAEYERCLLSSQSCLNEWHAMADIRCPRPPSPDQVDPGCADRRRMEHALSVRLREIMVTVDLDQVTTKQLRSKLAEHFTCDLQAYRKFVDDEILVILGQLDRASRVFDHILLGSVWNASDLEDLKKNGVGYILNTTREIDNFFPGRFHYMNVRVSDEESTELLKHWDNTYRFIERARQDNSRVLVHCRMGISRSASVVIAYAMKAYGWSHQKAMSFVKDRRSCIKPNPGFSRQLETYQGILGASKQRHKWLWRSRSETSLKRGLGNRFLSGAVNALSPNSRTLPKPSTRCSPLSPVLSPVRVTNNSTASTSFSSASSTTSTSGITPVYTEPRLHAPVQCLSVDPGRPKSWSPQEQQTDALLLSMEAADVAKCSSPTPSAGAVRPVSTSPSLTLSVTPSLSVASVSSSGCTELVSSTTRRIPCNGHDFSVSQNQALNLSLDAVSPCSSCSDLPRIPAADHGRVRRHAAHLERLRGSGEAPSLPPPSRSSSWGSCDSGSLGSQCSVQLRPRRQVAGSVWATGNRTAMSMLDLSSAVAEPVGPVTPGQVRRLTRWLESGAVGTVARPVSDVGPLAPDTSCWVDEVSVRSLVGRFEDGVGPEPRTKQSTSSSPAGRRSGFHLSSLASLTRRQLSQVFTRRRASSQTVPVAPGVGAEPLVTAGKPPRFCPTVIVAPPGGQSSKHSRSSIHRFPAHSTS